jgi:anti-sigma28 factor (negative regulator of flagellin synthesis)
MMIGTQPAATKPAATKPAAQLVAMQPAAMQPATQLAAMQPAANLAAKQSIQKGKLPVNIGKIVIGILEETKKDFLDKPEIQDFKKNILKVNDSFQDLDFDDTIKNVGRLVFTTVTDMSEAFLKVLMSDVEKKIEDNKIRIRNKLLEQNKTEEEINKIFNILQQLSDFSELKNLDLFNMDLLDLKKITEQIILQKLNLMGITSEEEISKVLEKLIHNLIGETIDDAITAAPITAAQAVASVWPLGSEPLVAVNKLNEIIIQTTEILIDTVMDSTVDAIVQFKVTKGGRKKRKTKSKQFYLNRIKRTLKYFYN